MRCAWQAYINLLPHWMRQDVDRLGKDDLQELRLRIGLPAELITQREIYNIDRIITNSDLAFVINNASNYSPWSATTISKGFLTAEGGHRIGICGVCTVNNSTMMGIHQPSSLCIRVSRDFYGISENLSKLNTSLLIIGPPGSGKTTLLRDLIRTISNSKHGSVSVVDEREEIFPLVKGQACYTAGNSTDILSGCSKSIGINAVLRSMNPVWIAVDEITAEEDSQALLHAGWCGVKLIATAHAGSVKDLMSRPVYRTLISETLFSNIVIMQKDKSWKIERILI